MLTASFPLGPGLSPFPQQENTVHSAGFILCSAKPASCSPLPGLG